MGSTYQYNDQAVENFSSQWLKVVKELYNHPSIITWVPFNESWGIEDVRCNKKQQSFTESIYYLTKSIDSKRPIIANDGWGYGEQVETKEELSQRINELMKIIKAADYFEGYCYTQLTDVEQEKNGLLDENREFKLDLDKIIEFNQIVEP